MLFFACVSTQAAEISEVLSKDGKVRFDLNGEITPGDASTLRSLIKRANDSGKLVATIRLNSPGGNLGEGVEIAEIVKNGKIATAVLSAAKCASACFVVFAAGNEKYAHYTAEIGVHGASDPSGRETANSNAATVAMGRIVRDLGVPPGIIGKMVVTPPDEMIYLTVDDLRSMRVTMLGKTIPACSEPSSTSTNPSSASSNISRFQREQNARP